MFGIINPKLAKTTNNKMKGVLDNDIRYPSRRYNRKRKV